MSIFDLLNKRNPQEFEARRAAIIELIAVDHKIVYEKSNDELKNSPLHITAAQNDVELVRLLCEQGVDLEAKNNAGKSPYQCALDANAVQTAELLAKILNYSPLHIAAIKNDVKLIRALRKSGAQIDAENKTGKTSFECALESNSGDAAALLASWGADIERLSEKQGTLLHRAIIEQDYRKTELLLRLGANCFAKFASIDEDTFDNAIRLVARLKLSVEWWRLLFSYGAGILCRIDDSSIDPAQLPIAEITPDMFFFTFSFNYEQHFSRMKKNTLGCEKGCFGIDDLKKSIQQGIPHDLKAYIRTLKYIIRDVPDAPLLLKLLKDLQLFRQELKGLMPGKKQPKSLTKIAMKFLLLPPQPSAISPVQLLPPTPTQDQNTSTQANATGSDQSQQSATEKNISEQNVLDNPKVTPDLHDKLQDYSEKLKSKNKKA